MSEFISLAEARVLTGNYRDLKDLLISPVYQNKNVLPVSETFDKNQIIQLLQQSDCEQMRIYLGIDDATQIRLVLVGVDADGNDIAQPDSLIVERGDRCPPDCPASSL